MVKESASHHLCPAEGQSASSKKETKKGMRNTIDLFESSSFTSLSGGNMVDGLPPAESSFRLVAGADP